MKELENNQKIRKPVYDNFRKKFAGFELPWVLSSGRIKDEDGKINNGEKIVEIVEKKIPMKAIEDTMNIYEAFTRQDEASKHYETESRFGTAESRQKWFAMEV